MALSAELQDWLCTGNAGAVATVDELGHPEICRVWGARAVAGQNAVDFFVLRPNAEKTLANLKRSSRASLNMVSPPTYRAIQFKGHTVVNAAGLDAEFCASQLELIDNSFVRVGLPPGSAKRMLRLAGDAPEYVCLRLAVEAIYDQSPKLGAGARIS